MQRQSSDGRCVRKREPRTKWGQFMFDDPAGGDNCPTRLQCPTGQDQSLTYVKEAAPTAGWLRAGSTFLAPMS